MNDLIPAVESKYSTYAESTGPEGLAASRDHRAFGGFSMGSMNTWRTFEHCLDCFRCFAPSSGGPTGSGEHMADLVRNSGHAPEDFFLFTASGTEDFACSGFKSGVPAMGETAVFAFASNEREGNLSFREREGYVHGRQGRQRIRLQRPALFLERLTLLKVPAPRPPGAPARAAAGPRQTQS